MGKAQIPRPTPLPCRLPPHLPPPPSRTVAPWPWQRGHAPWSSSTCPTLLEDKAAAPNPPLATSPSRLPSSLSSARVQAARLHRRRGHEPPFSALRRRGGLPSSPPLIPGTSSSQGASRGANRARPPSIAAGVHLRLRRHFSS